jgi:hypothetical protein
MSRRESGLLRLILLMIGSFDALKEVSQKLE